MAKKQRSRKTKRPARQSGGNPSKGGKRTQMYTSTRGKVVEFTPMPPMLLARIEEQVDAEYGEILPPTYEVKSIGGAETIPHTESTLETDEDKAAWAEYENRLSEKSAELSSLVLRALQIECLRPIIDDDDDWLERMEFMGMNVPEGKYDIQLFWVESQFIGNSDDINACLNIPMQLAGVSEEEMASAEKMFRDTVQEETA